MSKKLKRVSLVAVLSLLTTNSQITMHWLVCCEVIAFGLSL